jgi:hypothetical protein
MHKGALASAIAWIVLNASIFSLLFLFGLLNPAQLITLSLIYAVCDLICILFFCPFQALFMRNRCCAVCRIYNWDYFMICTPMIIYPGLYSTSLLLLSTAVLISWEASMKRNVHFFLEDTNANLNCSRCKEQLCARSISARKIK